MKPRFINPRLEVNHQLDLFEANSGHSHAETSTVLT